MEPDLTARAPGKIFKRYFDANDEYRQKVWEVLCREFFQRFVAHDAVVLDLGCGYGHFINHLRAGKKYGIDLNPDGASHLDPHVTYLCQDCTQPWALEAGSLDVIFTSNFFEHLADKHALRRTVAEGVRCLKPGGLLIALGPNIACLPGRYWDFSDHSLPLTETSVAEVLTASGLEVQRVEAKFLPYSMVGARQHPMALLRLYLRLPLLWRIFGKQFLVIARKASG